MQSAPLPPRLYDFVPSRACSLSVRKVRITHLNESRQSRHLLGLRLLIILIIIVVASARTAVLDATLRSVFQSKLSSIKAASHLHTKGWTTSLACCSAHDIHMKLYERFLLLRSTF